MKLEKLILLATACALSNTPVLAQQVSLKEAKLNIEHNATDSDTGFQGFIDSEGWQEISVKGPGGEVLHFAGRGAAGKLGLTELFFESVEPENKAVPLQILLKTFPEGEYIFTGKTMENGEGGETTIGKAWLSHAIPAGPKLVAPTEKGSVDAAAATVRWEPVTKTISGEPVKVIAYQLIVEDDLKEPPAHMIGKFGLSMYLPATVTEMQLPIGLLKPGTNYKWEVLAIEESGNQTLSSSEFRTN